jgi:hypothetical protein
MRSTVTYILRLLVDTDDPQTLRGSIVSVLEGKPRSFSDRQSLLDLLSAIARSALENQTCQEGNGAESEDEIRRQRTRSEMTDDG